MKVNLIHSCENITGEAATWLVERNTFLWIDIEGKTLFEYSWIDKSVTEHYFDDMPTTLIPLDKSKDSVIIALQNKLVEYNLYTKAMSTLIDIPTDNNNLRTNDGKASPDGRIWLGVMHFSNHDETGSLYIINKDLVVHKALDKQCIPNGIVWNKDGDRMYYADSGKACVTEYKYDAKTGQISSPRVAIQGPSIYGVPDGMTIDEEGMLWIAHWGGYGVYVWNPITGELLNKIELPVPNPASCTFGATDNKFLFITTARAGLTDTELEKYPMSGSLFVVETEVRGAQNHYPFQTT